MGQALLLAGDLAEAERELRPAADTSVMAAAIRVLSLSMLLRTLLAAGRIDEAAGLLGQATQLLAMMKHQGCQLAHLLCAIAETRRAIGDEAGANEMLARAKAELDASLEGMPDDARARFLALRQNARLISLT
jgi:hypothetical protein